MKKIIEIACEAGNAASSKFCCWSNETEHKLLYGSEFIFHYELAEHLWRYRADLDLDRLDFDRAFVEICARDGRHPIRTAVSRNTRRKFIVIHQKGGKKIVMRAQHFHNRGAIVAEAKGFLRSFIDYSSLTSAALVGLTAWEDCICPKDFLAQICRILSREFAVVIDAGFSPLDAENNVLFVFALAFRRDTAA